MRFPFRTSILILALLSILSLGCHGGGDASKAVTPAATGSPDPATKAVTPADPRPSVPATDGYAVMLSKATRVSLSDPRRMSEASARWTSTVPHPPDGQIRVEILSTNFKSPCVRVEHEVAAAGIPEEDQDGPVAMIANQAIVKTKPTVNENILREMLNTARLRLFGGVITEVLPFPDTYLIDFGAIACSATTGVEALPLALRELQRLQNQVEYAEPNFLYFKTGRPEDPELNEQWGLNNDGNGGEPGADIDAFKGWDIEYESPDTVVAVVDTGIDDTHDDLKDNIWVNSAEQKGQAGIDDDGNGKVDDVHGWDFYNKKADPMDVDAHGTHVAGIIGAVGNNHRYVAGVAWRVRLMALKFMEDWGGSTADAAKAIKYATTMKANIICASWGSSGSRSKTLRTAIDNTASQEILLAVAAGNSKKGRDIDKHPYYPAAYDAPNIISVAATNGFDVLAGFSNYGPASVDIAAPGVDIRSTVLGTTEKMSGTSQAAPFVAGACALVWKKHPGAPASTIKNLILKSADTFTDSDSDLSGKCVSGGRLNLYNALTATGGG